MCPVSDQSNPSADIVIVGAGIVGLSMAQALKARFPDRSLLVVDKEPGTGRHASGRNSGVLHSGLYYPTESLKAKLCVDGARQLRHYCQTRQLPLRDCGKLLVPTSPADEEQLRLLHNRAQTNGVRVELVDQAILNRMEPNANPNAPFALYSPDTAVFDPQRVLAQLQAELEQAGVAFLFGQPIHHIDDERRHLSTPNHHIRYGMLINCAGAYADCLAHQCGVGQAYTLMPFKGLYYELADTSALTFNHLIYPVPDLRVPFLGVHVTLSASNKVYFGPTAIPALGREQYAGLAGIDWTQLPLNLALMGRQYLRNEQGFRTMAHQEALRFLKPKFVQAAQALVPSLTSSDLRPSQKVGIRAQLFNRKRQQLEMDFIVARGAHSIHVLNAVSPAFTSAFSFAAFVLDSGLD
ncbi:MAG: L-2-hydroxyglutarate oxidase [Cyanobacteria bacterium HKST-UBA06]|nr:L-2-hydroxyglutarate oxidase [Cyanobacteria bacterium HKST-UBA06]